MHVLKIAYPEKNVQTENDDDNKRTLIFHNIK